MHITHKMKLVAALAIPLSLAFLMPCKAPEADEFDRLRGLVQPVAANEPYRIAFAAVHFVDAFWTGVAYGILDEAKHTGVEVVRTFSAGGYGKLPEQTSQLETLAALDLDALIIGAVSYDGLERPLRRLAENGVKIIVMDLTINTTEAALRVGQNQRAIGEAIGSYICEQKPRAKVATIPGPAGVEWTADRLEGIRTSASECDLELVGNIFRGSTLLEDGMAQASDLLVKHPDTDYVYAAAVSLGTGAAQAIRRMDGSAKVITSGFTDNTVDLMERGLIEMVVSEPGVLLGRLNLQYAVRLLNGDELPNLVTSEDLSYPSFDIPPMPVTLDDLGNYDLGWYDAPPADWAVPLSQ